MSKPVPKAKPKVIIAQPIKKSEPKKEEPKKEEPATGDGGAKPTSGASPSVTYPKASTPKITIPPAFTSLDISSFLNKKEDSKPIKKEEKPIDIFTPPKVGGGIPFGTTPGDPSGDPSSGGPPGGGPPGGGPSSGGPPGDPSDGPSGGPPGDPPGGPPGGSGPSAGSGGGGGGGGPPGGSGPTDEEAQDYYDDLIKDFINIGGPPAGKLFDPTSKESLFNISDMNVRPKIIGLNITTENKYTYEVIKALCLSKYHVINPPQTDYEIMMAKINTTPYIWEVFEGVEKAIDAQYKTYLEDELIGDYVDKNSSFKKALKSMVTTYKNKIRQIRNGWYNDWKDYGEIETLIPAITQLNNGHFWNNRQKRLKEYKAIFEKLYESAGGGNDDTNPLKWWIKNHVTGRLGKYETRIRDPKNNNAANASLYTDDQIRNKYDEKLAQIETIIPNSIRSTYRIIESVMEYTNMFADIDYSINGFRNKDITYLDRIAQMKNKGGYSVSLNMVYSKLIEIYMALANKFGNDQKFRLLMLCLNKRFFSKFDTAIECLYQIYIIRKNGEKNANRYNINNIISLYDRDFRDAHLPIEESGGVLNFFKSFYPSYKSVLMKILHGLNPLNWFDPLG